jgi:hypothetical protein
MTELEQRLWRMYNRVGFNRKKMPVPIGEDSNGRDIYAARPAILDSRGFGYYVTRTTPRG